MSESFPERGPERRRLPRGGRRAGDAAGVAPLLLFIGRGGRGVAPGGAGLARFWVARTTTGTVEEALRMMEGLRPDVVVAESAAASRLRLEWPEHVPVVEVTGEMREDPEALVEGIRQALRANPITRP